MFAPAVAATVFVVIGNSIIHCTLLSSLETLLTFLKGVATTHGSISFFGNQIFLFKIVLTIVATLWLVALGPSYFLCKR